MLSVERVDVDPLHAATVAMQKNAMHATPWLMGSRAYMRGQRGVT